MSKYTPGPWETLTFSNHELQTDFAMVKIGGRVHMVGYSDEDKANACLIAAAPELLEACKALTQIKNIDIAATGPLKAAVEKAAAAIAKAEGARS